MSSVQLDLISCGRGFHRSRAVTGKARPVNDICCHSVLLLMFTDQEQLFINKLCSLLQYIVLSRIAYSVIFRRDLGKPATNKIPHNHKIILVELHALLIHKAITIQTSYY